MNKPEYNFKMQNACFRALSIFILSAFSPLHSLADQSSTNKTPALKCGIENPLNPDSKREANAREATRAAANAWRFSSQTDSGLIWIERFSNCLEVSGRPIEDIVADRAEFEKKLMDGLTQKAKMIQKSKNGVNLEKNISSFRQQLAIAEKLAPSIKEKAESLVLNRKELESVVNARNLADSKEEESCSPKDFANRLGPVRDQTDKGWCYAFSAADLVTFKVGPDTVNFSRRVSPSDMALLFNREKTAKTLFDRTDIAAEEGGWPDKALRNALDYGGFCLEKNAPSEDFAFGTLDDVISDIRSLDPGPNSSPDFEEKLCHKFQRVVELFPNIQFQEYADIFAALGDKDWNYFVKLNEMNCAGERHSYGITKEKIHFLGNENVVRDRDDIRNRREPVASETSLEMIGAIDEQLNKNNISTVGVRTGLILKNDPKSGHAMTLVGRQWDRKTKTCKYLLRNSWGVGCSSKIKDALCSKAHTGHLWVDRESLNTYIKSVTYID